MQQACDTYSHPVVANRVGLAGLGRQAGKQSSQHACSKQSIATDKPRGSKQGGVSRAGQAGRQAELPARLQQACDTYSYPVVANRVGLAGLGRQASRVPGMLAASKQSIATATPW